MKKFLLATLFVILAAALGMLCFSACGNNNNDTPPESTIKHYGDFMSYKYFIADEKDCPNGNIRNSALRNSLNLNEDGEYYIVLDMTFDNFTFAGDSYTIKMRISGFDKLSATLQEAATGKFEEHKEGDSTVISTTFTPPRNREESKYYRIIYQVKMMGDTWVSAGFTIDDLAPSEPFSCGLSAYSFEVNEDNTSCRLSDIDIHGSVKIPSYYGMRAVTDVAGKAFGECRYDIAVSENNQYLLCIDGILYNIDKTKLIAVLPSTDTMTIPDSVTSIGDGAFYSGSGSYLRSKFTSITIPDSVTSIGAEAFYKCKDLKNVNFGSESSLTSIGKSAFAGCSSLTDITIPDGVTSIGAEAFYNCKNIKTATIPVSAISSIPKDNLQKVVITSGGFIDNRAFYSCNSLTDITIPASVTFIGDSAFGSSSISSLGCTNLEKVHITDLAAWCNINFSNVTANPLYYAHELYLNDVPVTAITAEMLRGAAEIKGYAFYGCTNLTDITIPGSVLSIGDGVFEGCTSLTGITIPASVLSIGDRVFYDCTNLENITVNGDNPKYSAQDGILYDKDKTELIYAPTKKTKVTIPSSVLSIGSYAFTDSDIASIEFAADSRLTSIGKMAFYSCDSLENIVLPANLTSIGDFAFCFCKITSVTIPASVTSIGLQAFSGCADLKSVTFEITTGWKVSITGNSHNGVDITVSDVNKNADLLTNINNYDYWYRTE